MSTGDNPADWDQLRNSMPHVLSLGFCEFPFASADVGGFFESPGSDLLTRWY
jgi:alpha 1,3-glucosidase